LSEVETVAASPLGVASNPRFAQKPGLAVLKLAMRILSKLYPPLAAKIGLMLFLTPPRHGATKNKREKELRSRAATSSVETPTTPVSVYVWGKGPAVLLAHSWGGRGTQLGAFVDVLVPLGYKVVAFDGPAHGSSPGQRTDMIEFSAAINAVEKQHGPLYAVIGHSFGAATSLLCIRSFKLRAKKLVLIGCIAHGQWAIETFGEVLGLDRAVVERMQSILEERHSHSLKWKALAMPEMARDSDIPLMIVHDVDDKEVPYDHAMAIHAMVPSARLIATRGNGHRRIVRDPEVIRQVVQFLHEFPLTADETTTA
jgi:pimeloyl-ACP methyl ester carboxylesterase